MVEIHLGLTDFSISGDDHNKYLAFEPLIAPGVKMGFRVIFAVDRLGAIKIGQALQGTVQNKHHDGTGTDDAEVLQHPGAILLDSSSAEEGPSGA